MTTVYKLPVYEQHPVAIALMPGGMDDAEFEAFCADVQERGIIYPITIYQGKVLDGWHRYRAAKKTGCSVTETLYGGKDPAGYVAACNVLRRKLSSLQRALVGARLHRDYGITQREACRRLGVSNEVINLILKAIDGKNTKLIKRIETDSDFTRSDLREELENTGLLRAKVSAAPVMPPAPASVFTSHLSAAAADVGLIDIKPKRMKVSAAQLLCDDFKALMDDEKFEFMRLVWPIAKKFVPPNEVTPLRALTNTVKKDVKTKSAKLAA